MIQVELPSPYRLSSGWIGRPYEIQSIAPTINIDGETLYAKPEFHMSIFSVKKYAPELADKQKVSIEAAEQTLLENAAELLSSNPVKVTALRDEFRLVEEGEKKTIVVMCDAEGLGEFFIGMKKLLGSDLSLQPTHITLYTREGGGGIGPASNNDVIKLSRELTADEKQLVKRGLRFNSNND